MAVGANTPFLRADFPSALTQPELIGPIFQRVKQTSITQQLMRQVPVGLNGINIPVMNGTVNAGWVAEGAQKPVTSSGVTLATMAVKKIAAILVVSEEVMKLNPLGFVEEMQAEVAEAFARAFDSAVFYGGGGVFPTYINQTTKEVVVPTKTAAQGGVYADLNSGLALLVNDGKYLTGSAFDATFEPILNGSVDANGRPLFVDSQLAVGGFSANGQDNSPGGPSGLRAGNLLGRPSYIGKGVTNSTGSVYGFEGDWSKSIYGVAQQITFRASRDTAVALDPANPTVLTSTFQNNLVAILAEAYMGVLVEDPQSFVRIAKTANASGS